jgi:AraC family transcriptional regulator
VNPGVAAAVDGRPAIPSVVDACSERSITAAERCPEIAAIAPRSRPSGLRDLLVRATIGSAGRRRAAPHALQISVTTTHQLGVTIAAGTVAAPCCTAYVPLVPITGSIKNGGFCRWAQKAGRNGGRAARRQPVELEQVRAMDVSTSAYDDRNISTVDVSPAEIVKRQTAHWRGLQAETMQFAERERIEYHFKEQFHLLIAVEQAARYDGETWVEGLPRSTLRDFSHKLTSIPPGRAFFAWQNPRILPRVTYIYIDPLTLPVDPELGLAQIELQPRLFFEDNNLWQTVLKLKGLIGSVDAGSRMYAEALGGILAHELMRLDGAAVAPRPPTRGGLAGWQQKRVANFIEENLTEDISLGMLADLVRLSPYHFLRSFKRSFGEPPYRYYTGRRIERAKALLASPRASVTEIGFQVGFSGTSAFSATFHRITGQTPTDYRRSLE